MNPLFVRFVLLASAIAALTACKRENEIPVLTVSPSTPVMAVTSGNVISFHLTGTSDKSSLSRLIIRSKLENGFSITEKDSALSGKSFSWTWEYLVPHAAVDYNKTLTFDLYEADGDHMALSRTLSVTLGAALLTEVSGQQFYSRNSTTHGGSAFDLEERIPVLYTVDSARRDIQDQPADGAQTEISRTWISPAGGRMVRFNGFDYANATDVSLRNAFHTGTPLEELRNVAVNDIILTRLGSLPANVSHYVAIRVTDILDEPGSADNDRYTFNMKWAVFME
ncbi:MAG: hypothetical protein KF797_02715 [Flavobacteriales bacterium]|nr:hypothetical protein [Flavobacteriales bacterium]